MADHLTQQLLARSPLQDFGSRFAMLPGSASVTEEPFVAMVDLWLDPACAAAGAAAGILGLAGLPECPSTVSTAGDNSVIWFGPQEWLVCSTESSGEVLEAALQQAITEDGGAAVDVSAQRTILRLQGADARNVLAKGCSLDLHPSVFGPGAAAQTMLGQAAVVLIPLDHNGTDYQILVRSSFARYLAEWLIDAAEEFGVTPARL